MLFADRPSKDVNILIVDDKPDNLFILNEILKKEGRNFIKAASGNEALKKAMENHIDLMLLDIQMPNMDGFTVAKLLSTNPKTMKIPIIFVTAVHKSKESVLKGLETGAVDYLLKPLDIDITRAKVDSFLMINKQQQELIDKGQAIKYLEFLVNQSRDIICILDGQSMVIEGVNANFEKLTGFQEKELVGTKVLEYGKLQEPTTYVESSDGETLKKLKFQSEFLTKEKIQLRLLWEVISKDGKWFCFLKNDAYS